MNTAPKPYSLKSAHSSNILGDSARNAIESVKDTVEDALGRGQATVSQAEATASEITESTKQQITTFTSELEAMTKRNPLGTLANAAITGVLIGFLARGRS